MPGRSSPAVDRLRAQLASAYRAQVPDLDRIAELRAELAEELAIHRVASALAQAEPMSESLRRRIAAVVRPVLASSDVDRGLLVQ